MQAEILFFRDWEVPPSGEDMQAAKRDEKTPPTGGQLQFQCQTAASSKARLKCQQSEIEMRTTAVGRQI